MLIQIIVVINYSLQGVWIVLQLIVATFLSIKVIKTKRYNIIPLILFFFISSLRIISFFMSPSFLIIFLIMVQFPNILLVIFTKLTFFKHKKSPFKVFLIILIIVRFFDFIIRINFQISIPMTYYLEESNLIFYYYILFSITISFLLSHLWLGITALRYYKIIKSSNIEPWIKLRYGLIGWGSFIYTFSIFLYYLIPYDIIGVFAFPNIVYGYIILGFTVCYSLSMYFAWIMPKCLKNRLNKDFQVIEEKEYEEDELLEIVKKELSERNS